MSRIHVPIQAFNAGEVSLYALARVDLAKMRMAMEVQENFLPKVLGPAIFRPGTGYLGATRNGDRARLIPFIFNASVKAVLELTPNVMRPRVIGMPIERPVVSPRLVNPTFAGGLAGWTQNSEPGAICVGGDGLVLTGTGFNEAGLYQIFRVDQPGVEHALRIVVESGPVSLLIGTGLGLEDLVGRTALRAGEHSIAFTPLGGFVYIEFRSASPLPRVVTRCDIEPAGPVEIATPWNGAVLPLVRTVQSGDVLYCASEMRQRRIERRSQRSWSVVDYVVDDGPFRPTNGTSTTLSFSKTSGRTSVTASRPLFRPGHVGALFRATLPNQAQTGVVAGPSQWSDPIRVSGLAKTDDQFYSEGARLFRVEVTDAPTGGWAGKITIQRSFAEPGGWEDMPTPAAGAGQSPAFTANGVRLYDDGLDNQIIYYRVGFAEDDYTSGAAQVEISTNGGAQTSVLRVRRYVSPTQVAADVLQPLSQTGPTADWAEGLWSDARGWPASVTIHDGRLTWGQNDTVQMSVSDAYESFDANTVGDAAPIIRSVATGGFEGILWMLSMQRLLAGTASQEVSIRSSSFDEPLTPTAFTARDCSTRGSAPIAAVKVDTTGIFVQRNRREVMELQFDVQAADYGSRSLTRMKPEMCAAGVVDIAVQRQPDTRVWFVLADGTCAVLTYERADEVVAWTPFRTSGAVEAICTLPGDDDDEIYFVVRRSVNGSIVRMVERLSREAEAKGGILNKVADSSITVEYDPPSNVVGGLSHLEGRSVVAWGDGKALATTAAPLTVVNGAVTLPVAISSATVGLPYQGRLRTTKLAYGAGDGSALTKRKRVDGLGVLMGDVGWKGVRIGRDFEHMTGIAQTLRGRPLATSEVLKTYDFDGTALNGAWDTDARVHLTVDAPHPCTLMGLVIGMTTSDGIVPDTSGNGR